MRNKKLTQEEWAQFENDLSDNENNMGEMAALSVTCEQWNIDEECYYDNFVPKEVTSEKVKKL